MDRSEYAGAKAENGIPTCKQASAINACSILFSESTTTGRSADKFLLRSACEIFFTFSNTSAYVTDSHLSLRFALWRSLSQKYLVGTNLCPMREVTRQPVGCGLKRNRGSHQYRSIRSDFLCNGRIYCIEFHAYSPTFFALPARKSFMRPFASGSFAEIAAMRLSSIEACSCELSVMRGSTCIKA